MCQKQTKTGTLKNQLIADVVLAIVSLGAASEGSLPSTASGYLHKSVSKLATASALKSLGPHWSEQCQLTLARVVRTYAVSSVNPKPKLFPHKVKSSANR